MKILITNHHLQAYCGTEIFTYTIARALKNRNHDLYVYSPYLGGISKEIIALGIPVVNDLRSLDKDFDVAHVHHNILAYEVRNRFPELPIIFFSHGVKPYLEQPPPTEIGIVKYMAVSEEVKDSLINLGVFESKIGTFRNPVNENTFFPKKPINVTPKKALVISNYIDNITEKIIRNACSKLSIDLRFVGARFEIMPNDKIPEVINEVDIVITLGRGAIESMFCGRIPIIIDRWVGDGMVTPKNFSDLIQSNFSGRYHGHKYTVSELCTEIKKYQQKYSEELRQLALEEFSVTSQTDKLLKIYEECLGMNVPEINKANKRIISFFCKAIDRTRNSTQNITRKEIISEIGGFRPYKMYRLLGKFRKLINK